jgi:hypothetical protein
MKPKTPKKIPAKRPAKRTSTPKRSSVKTSRSLLSSAPSFSRRKLVLLASVFMLFGVFFIFLSRASTLPLTVVEAEAMTPPAGTIVIDDSIASGTKALKFSVDGTATSSFSLPSESSNLSLRAKGVSCNGSPQAVVKVDGGVVQTVTINSSGWADYTVAAKLLAGTHTLTVSFTNDYNQYAGNSGNLKCSRDLYVDKIEFLGAVPVVSNTVSLTGLTEGGTITGPVAVEAKATGFTLTKVEFYIDNVLYRTENSAPFCLAADPNGLPCYNWNDPIINTQAANGAHAIKAIGYDATGAKQAEKIVNITVSNTVAPPPPVTSSPSFSLVGTHPYASSQPTSPGKILTGLQEYNGKLYMGYGDTFANTGPIRITSYSPTANSFTTEYTSATEAIWTYRLLNNKLFAPSDDPQGDFSTDYVAGLPWGSVGSVRMTHNFDMAQLGTTLYAVGSKDSTAVVAKSNDGGATWSNALTELISGDIARYYFAAVLNNKLYVQAYGYYGNKPNSSSKVFDGVNWTNGPNMLPLGGHGWHPRVFGSKLLYQTHLPNNMLNVSGNDKSRFMTFDGTTATSPLSVQIYDFVIIGNYVYVLGIDGSILRSTDLANWVKYASAPGNSRSIGALGSTLYIGTSDSKLYKAQ